MRKQRRFQSGSDETNNRVVVGHDRRETIALRHRRGCEQQSSSFVVGLHRRREAPTLIIQLIASSSLIEPNATSVIVESTRLFATTADKDGRSTAQVSVARATAGAPDDGIQGAEVAGQGVLPDPGWFRGPVAEQKARQVPTARGGGRGDAEEEHAVLREIADTRTVPRVCCEGHESFDSSFWNIVYAMISGRGEGVYLKFYTHYIDLKKKCTYTYIYTFIYMYYIYKYISKKHRREREREK